jgi:hypothetical protein
MIDFLPSRVTSPYQQKAEELGELLDFVTEGVGIRTSGLICGQMVEHFFSPLGGCFWKVVI